MAKNSDEGLIGRTCTSIRKKLAYNCSYIYQANVSNDIYFSQFKQFKGFASLSPFIHSYVTVLAKMDQFRKNIIVPTVEAVFGQNTKKISCNLFSFLGGE